MSQLGNNLLLSILLTYIIYYPCPYKQYQVIITEYFVITTVTQVQMIVNPFVIDSQLKALQASYNLFMLALNHGNQQV